MTIKGNPESILAELKRLNRFLISVHVSPDGDALGSQLALMLALKKLHKSVELYNNDPVPEIYRFLPHADEIRIGSSLPETYDAYIVLDSDPSRTGFFQNSFPVGTLINIDHHITNEGVWPYTWLDPSASATGELIYRLILLLGVPIDREIALCLYTSIFTDTGSFRYTNTTPESMRIAATLLEYGVDPWLVTEQVYESFAFQRVQLLGHVLANIQRNPNGTIAWVVVTDDLYRKTGTTAQDTDNFVNFVRSVHGVEVAVLFRQTGDTQYKISLRSKGRIDLSGLAQLLGGGGHKNAAGATLNGLFEDVRDSVLVKLEHIVSLQLQKPAV